MTCRYLTAKADGKYCQLKNSQVPNNYVRRVCIQDTDAALCIKALEALKEADRLFQENNISCVTLYREASTYFANLKDFLKAILCRIKLITFLKAHNYYEQAILEAKEVKTLYESALRSEPSLRRTEIGDKVASLEQSIQVAYNQSESTGLVKPSAVLQTISALEVENAVSHARHYSIERELEQEIEKVIHEEKGPSEYTPKLIPELGETSPRTETHVTTEIGGAPDEVKTTERISTNETSGTIDAGGTMETLDTIEEVDSTVGFLSPYVEKARHYEKLAKTQISEGSFDKVTKSMALSTLSWILAGGPQEGLTTLNNLLKDSKGKRELVKKDPIFVVARSLILAIFNKDMGKYYEAELLIRQQLKGYSDEEMELITQGLTVAKQLIGQ